MPKEKKVAKPTQSAKKNSTKKKNKPLTQKQIKQMRTGVLDPIYNRLVARGILIDRRKGEKK